jgi:hypothetical protein
VIRRHDRAQPRGGLIHRGESSFRSLGQWEEGPGTSGQRPAEKKAMRPVPSAAALGEDSEESGTVPSVPNPKPKRSRSRSRSGAAASETSCARDDGPSPVHHFLFAGDGTFILVPPTHLHTYAVGTYCRARRQHMTRRMRARVTHSCLIRGPR